MGENRSVLTALGAILGLVLLVYIIMQGVGYLRGGMAEFEEMQRQAGAPILLSETIGEAAVAAGEGVTETATTTETAVLTETVEVAATTAVTESAAAETGTAETEVAATTPVTETAAVATTETTTPTAGMTETVAAESEVAATDVTTSTEAVTETAVVTDEVATEEGAVAESTVVTDTEATTATEAVAEAPAAEEPAAEEPAAEAVAMTVPTPEEVAPIFTKAGCIGCHVIPNIPGAAGAIGPDLSNIGVDGATRIPGYTEEEYLRESILNPNAFIAPECPTGPCLPGLMIQNLGDVLTPEEIDMVIAYLATMGVN